MLFWKAGVSRDLISKASSDGLDMTAHNWFVPEVFRCWCVRLFKVKTGCKEALMPKQNTPALMLQIAPMVQKVKWIVIY